MLGIFIVCIHCTSNCMEEDDNQWQLGLLLPGKFAGCMNILDAWMPDNGEFTVF
jgi:hypothetical protein